MDKGAKANVNEAAIHEKDCPNEKCGENASCRPDMDSGISRCQCDDGFYGIGRIDGFDCGEFTRKSPV